ncbi:unnamed protein product [Lampetra fluviatilis]
MASSAATNGSPKMQNGATTARTLRRLQAEIVLETDTPRTRDVKSLRSKRVAYYDRMLKSTTAPQKMQAPQADKCKKPAQKAIDKCSGSNTESFFEPNLDKTILEGGDQLRHEIIQVDNPYNSDRLSDSQCKSAVIHLDIDSNMLNNETSKCGLLSEINSIAREDPITEESYQIVQAFGCNSEDHPHISIKRGAEANQNLLINDSDLHHILEDNSVSETQKLRHVLDYASKILKHRQLRRVNSNHDLNAGQLEMPSCINTGFGSRITENGDDCSPLSKNYIHIGVKEGDGMLKCNSKSDILLTTQVDDGNYGCGKLHSQKYSSQSVCNTSFDESDSNRQSKFRADIPPSRSLETKQMKTPFLASPRKFNQEVGETKTFPDLNFDGNAFVSKSSLCVEHVEDEHTSKENSKCILQNSYQKLTDSSDDEDNAVVVMQNIACERFTDNGHSDLMVPHPEDEHFDRIPVKYCFRYSDIMANEIESDISSVNENPYNDKLYIRDDITSEMNENGEKIYKCTSGITESHLSSFNNMVPSYKDATEDWCQSQNQSLQHFFMRGEDTGPNLPIASKIVLQSFDQDVGSSLDTSRKSKKSINTKSLKSARHKQSIEKHLDRLRIQENQESNREGNDIGSQICQCDNSLTEARQHQTENGKQHGHNNSSPVIHAPILTSVKSTKGQTKRDDVHNASSELASEREAIYSPDLGNVFLHDVLDKHVDSERNTDKDDKIHRKCFNNSQDRDHWDVESGGVVNIVSRRPAEFSRSKLEAVAESSEVEKAPVMKFAESFSTLSYLPQAEFRSINVDINSDTSSDEGSYVKQAVVDQLNEDSNRPGSDEGEGRCENSAEWSKKMQSLACPTPSSHPRIKASRMKQENGKLTSSDGSNLRKSKIQGKSKTTEFIRRSGYRRHWDRSSIDWSTYQSGELKPKSAVRNRPATANILLHQVTTTSQKSTPLTGTKGPTAASSCESQVGNQRAVWDSLKPLPQRPASSNATLGSKGAGAVKRVSSRPAGDSISDEHQLSTISSFMKAKNAWTITEWMANNSDSQAYTAASTMGAGCIPRWIYLPEELWLRVFSFLSHGDLTQAACTCHLFNRLTSDQSLWRSVRIEGSVRLSDAWLTSVGRRRPEGLCLTRCRDTRGTVTAAGLRALFKQCGDRITELDVSNSAGVTLTGDSVLLHASTHCRNLSTVNLAWSAATQNGVIALARSVSRLEKVNLNGCPVTDEAINILLELHGQCLTELELFGCHALTPSSLMHLGEKCPSLRVLNLGRVPKATDTCLMRLATSMQLVQTLNLTALTAVRDQSVHIFSQRCPNLQHLILTSCLQITDKSLVEIATYLPKICSLDVSGCRRVSDVGVQALAMNCRLLNTLDLSSTSISKRGVCLLGSYCRDSLQSVKFSFCQDITENAVHKLVENCHRLKLLHLYGCRAVKDLNGIQRARPSLEIHHDLQSRK